MDFGLAARAEDSGEAKLTKDGTVMGTPAYMSPEQAKGQKGEAHEEGEEDSFHWESHLRWTMPRWMATVAA